jgi:predicted extracellular nuclease
MKRFFFLLVFSLFLFSLFPQRESLRNFRVILYNVENYFDIYPDSIADDSEYLPGGIRGWNRTKYLQKQANIAKVITAIGGWDTPALVGLCEVESRRSLIDLTRNSPLKSFNYRFIHHESPDLRGIDVALLYHPFQFFPISDKAIPVKLPNTTRPTRDILYVSGTTFSGDTLHIFLAHYPSRLGGELESEERRVFVSSVIRMHADSLFAIYANPNILIMGDFNDYPTNKSMLETLGANPITQTTSERELYNLTYQLHAQGKGTYKHNGEWGMLDQIIVSGSLLNPASGLFTIQQDVHIFDADFLLENDENFLGKRPFRTYIGMRYHGGFSDHLPVFVDFWY